MLLVKSKDLFKQQKKDNKNDFITDDINGDLWIIYAQKEFLKNQKQMNQLKLSLGVFIDEDGFIKDRLQNSDLSSNSKFPILLPKSNRFTEFVILVRIATSNILV